jgi:hypothetical protein
MSTCAEHDIAEMIATSPAVGFVAKFHLSAEALTKLLMTPSPAAAGGNGALRPRERNTYPYALTPLGAAALTAPGQSGT